MYYLVLLLTLVITSASQGYINSMYKKSRVIPSKSNMTGRDVARKILDANGLKNVKIQEVAGTLSDHYDPRNKTVSLSKDIYENTSLASISVAAHECGHAIQDKEGYLFLRIRSSIIPLVNFASRVGYIIILISVVMSLMKLLWIGILMEGIILLFQIITLPVEFNASSRALKQILDLKIVEKDEHTTCRGMLKAAALTYVASVLAAILEIIRLLWMTRRDD
jgi:Zn-dependent membrane protease YugP